MGLPNNLGEGAKGRGPLPHTSGKPNDKEILYMERITRSKLQKRCPAIWSILNMKAKSSLPYGFIEFLNKRNFKKRAWQTIEIPEKHTQDLINLCGREKVGRAYRRDLSAVNNEERLLDILHEIVLCSFLGKLSNNIELRPLSGDRTSCDVSLQIDGFIIYGEVKRFPDKWWLRKNSSKVLGRSIFKEPKVEKSLYSRPRYMDLKSKLKEVPRQFPNSTINLLFVFTSSFGVELQYLKQALYGEKNFFTENRETYCLMEDGLYYKEEWLNVSGCCLPRVDVLNAGNIVVPTIFENPKATLPIPGIVRNALTSPN